MRIRAICAARQRSMSARLSTRRLSPSPRPSPRRRGEGELVPSPRNGGERGRVRGKPPLIRQRRLPHFGLLEGGHHLGRKPLQLFEAHCFWYTDRQAYRDAI